MATLTAEATLGTALSVECGHHVATYRGTAIHTTEFRKPVAIKRNSKTAEYETTSTLFDSTASSGMGAWESVLDYDQYNLNVTDKQPITLAADFIKDDGSVIPSSGLADSGRIGVVFDFTEYYQCTPRNIINNLVVKYTASGANDLEIRSTTSNPLLVDVSGALYVDATYVTDDYVVSDAQTYTSSLTGYTIDDGFVTVWFKGENVTLSNITARISVVGRAKASITPVISNTFTVYNDVIKNEEIDFRYERDTVISFDNINLSSWPSTYQNESFAIDSLVNFFGVLDNGALQFPGYVNYLPPTVYATQKTISSSRSQATENENPEYTPQEQSPTTQLQLNDNRSELAANNSWRMPSSLPRGYIEWDSNLFSSFGNSISGATISVWWFGTTVPNTFIMADDPAMWHIYGNSVEDPNFAAYTYNQFRPNDGPKEDLYHQGDRSIILSAGYAGPEGTAPLPLNLRFIYPSNNKQEYGNTARNFVVGKWADASSIITNGWNNFQMSFTTGTTPTVKAYLNGVAGTTSAYNVSEVELLGVTQQLSSDFGIINGKTSIHATYYGTGRTATGWRNGYPNEHGTARGENGAFFFLDNQYIDLDIQRNRQIFRTIFGTPTFTPKINGQTPKIFISGDDRTINNNGVVPDTKRNVEHEYLANENINTVIGGAPAARIRGLTPTTFENGEYGDYINTTNRDTFEADSTLPVVTYNRMDADVLEIGTNDPRNLGFIQPQPQPLVYPPPPSPPPRQLALTRMGVDLAYVYPSQGTFENAFIKSKLLLDLRLTSGPVNTQANFSVSQPNIDMILGGDATLASDFDVDTTTGKIHIFRFDPLTFSTAFTTTQTGTRLLTDSVAVDTQFSITVDSISTIQVEIDFDMNFTTSQTARRVISDLNTITTPITTEFNTFGRIHIFTFEPTTLATAFNQITDAKIFTFEPVTLTANFLLDTGTTLDSGAVNLQVSFTDDFDGDTQINSGKIRCNTAFSTLQTGAVLRKDINDIDINTSFGVELDVVGVVIDNTLSITSEFDFDTTTGRIHIFTFAPHTFATNLALNETGKIHVFTFTPHTFSTAFDFDTTGRIHIFRFVPRTFNIATTFNPNTGRIHLFNLPPITLPIQTIFDRNGGLRVEAQPTLDANITVDAFAPIPLAPITLNTSLTLSQPTVEIVKQSNVVSARAQTRVRLVRPHPRTILAERLETVSSLTLQAWQDVAQWLDLDSFEGFHRLTHRTTVDENRTIEAEISTRTLLVTEADRDELADTFTATYLANADTRSYIVDHQHSYNVHSHDRQYIIPKTHTNPHYHRLVTADTETRVVLAERLT